VVYSINKKLKRFDDKKKGRIISKMLKDNRIEVVNKGLFLEWDNVIEMSKNNIIFGAHTMSHPILSKISLKEVRKEILGSKGIIEKKIGKVVRHFAYPNGHKSDFDEGIINILKGDGFETAVTYIAGWNDKNSDPFRIRRMFVRYEDDIVIFKNKMVGFDIVFSKIYRIFTG
jgi:peptidoglycan/xylan/chitin deacetylase (PgdA/CDA1 family)